MSHKSKTSGEYALELAKDVISQQIQIISDKSDNGMLEEEEVRKLEILSKTLISIMNAQPKKKKNYSISGKNVSNEQLTKYAK